MNKRLYIAYENCWIPKDAGYSELTIKINNNKLHLYSAEKIKGKLDPKEDFGILKTDGKFLVTDAKNFPFEQWGMD